MLVQNGNEKETPAEFQTAIAATKFGKFNIILILGCIPAALTIQFESTLNSFIIPAAACDLDLTSTEKGLLNSMPFFEQVPITSIPNAIQSTLIYNRQINRIRGRGLNSAPIGMVSAGFFWGFLLDTLGRKKILLVGFCGECFILLAKSISPNVAVLSTCAFLAGSITGGMYVALATYIMEFHSTEYRGKIQMIFGMMFACGNMIIPLVASAILPLNFTIRLLFVDFHAWNLLIFVSCVNPIISTIAFFLLPETPKFLMTLGKNQEALDVFRTMYQMNTGDLKENYPVKALIQEIEEKTSTANKKSAKKYFISGWQQISPIFGKKYRVKLLIVCMVQSMFGMSINTLRLYMPQIFQAVHEYQVTHNGTSSNLCDTLEILRSPPATEEDVICTVNLENNFRVYFNSIIIAVVTIVGYALAGTLINLFGKKRLLVVLSISACLAASSMYFSPNTATTLALSSLFLACTGICFDIFMTIIAVVFPTTLRAMTISICLMSGRSLSVLGNMAMPFLVELGCAPPFLLLSSFILVAVLLSSIIPNADKEDMK